MILEERHAEVQARKEEVEKSSPTSPSWLIQEVPNGVDANKIRREISDIEERMTAMEPVNMRALEQHEELKEREIELKEKLDKLISEKRELKQRMTSFGRQSRAFDGHIPRKSKKITKGSMKSYLMARAN